jgi:hypothetical protein
MIVMKPTRWFKENPETGRPVAGVLKFSHREKGADRCAMLIAMVSG